MITITIKYADGSPDWSQSFNSQADADHWLAEEKAMPYWKSSNIVTQAARVDPQPDAATVAAQLAKINNARAALAALNTTQVSLANLPQTLDNILIAMGIK